MPKILAIDDKQDNLITVSALLRNFIPDCTVITSDSGAEGIKKAEAEQPDTILLDVIMPEMDGFEVCRRLKSNEKTKHIPVVMLTAIKTDAGSRVKGLELGADAFLSKPIDETELVAQIKVMLRIKKAEDDLRKEKEELERRVEERTVELAKKNDHLKMEIEERKRTEEALGQSEERYRILVENSLNAIILYEQEKILFANKTFYNIFGYDSGELEGLTVDDILAPEVAEYVSEHRRRRLAGEIEKTAVYETKGRRKNGEIFDMEISVCLVAYQNKQCCMAFLSDISGRKKAEDALREQEAFWKTLINTIPTPVFYKDRDGKYLGFNTAFETFFGATKKRLIGKSAFDIHPPELAEKYNSKDIELFNSGGVQTYETQWQIRDGSLRDIIFNKGVFTDNKGNVDGLIGTIFDITERKQTQESLRESEDFFTQMFVQSKTSTQLFDPDGHCIRVNPEFCNLFGVTEKDITSGYNVFNDQAAIDSGVIPLVRQIFDDKKANKWKINFDIETASVSTNTHSTRKEKIWIDVLGYPVLHRNGSLQYVVLQHHDITEQKQAEEALRESEEKHKRIVENALTGIYQVEKEGGFIMANQRIAEMFGYDSPESLMSSVDSIASLYVHPEERAMILQEIDEKGSVYGKEVKFKRKTGEHFWVKYHVRVLRDKEKTIYEGLVEDVTAEKSSQEAQRASELRYRSLFENASMGISLTTSDGQMLDANNSILQMMSASRSDIEQLNVTDFYKNFQDRESLLKRLERDGSVHGFETILKRKDGTLFDARLNLTKLNIDNRDLLLTIIEDFTKEKTLTENLERAQRMEAIGTLAGGVAHDLNNILGGLVSYPELLLLKLPEDSPLRDMVSTIQKSGEKAAATVQDLLTLARRGLLVTELINLNDVVSEYLKSPEHEKLQSYHPGVHIETRLERYPLHIEGSPIHLSKTVMNLISNAAEAMPEGGKLTVSLENKYIDRPVSGYDNMDEGDYVVLTVSDTGTGIASNDLEKIFEPFYTKKKMGRSGTGLGMAVVWGTVKDHKGYIDVQSSEGKGTTFTLYFPATRKKLSEDETPLSVESYSGNGESILVIDDVEDQRNIATGMLEELCYSVASVSSGEEAVDYLKTNRADLILLDMIMDPGMDGLDTYKKILEIYPGQKAIISSGFSETDRVKETLALGAGAYIRKPFLLEKIGLAVKEELEK